MVAKAKLPFDRVIGVDLGNGFVKVRSVTKEGRVYELTLPSCFAYLRDVGESVKETGESVKEVGLDLDTYEIDGVEYVWGNDIKHVEKVTNTYGHENRYKSKAYKIMAQIVMATIARDLEIDAKEDVLLVTGVPSGESGTSKEEDCANAFYGESKGLHKIVVNGERQVFTISKVFVDSQALATIKGRYLDVDGHVLEEGYEKWKVAVIDIGAGTTDLDIVHGLRRQAVNHSVPTGFRDIYAGIRAEINKKYVGLDVSDYKLLDVITETQEKGKDKYLYRPSKQKDAVDFTKAFYDGIKEVSIATQQAIMEKWKSQVQLDEILLVGASAEEFKTNLSEVSDIIEIPKNNTNSNVEGYYRFGVALNKASAN